MKKWKKGLALLAATGLVAAAGYRGLAPADSKQLREHCRGAVRNRNWEQLQTEASRWITADPNADEARLFLATSLQQQRKFEESLNSLMQICTTSPEAEPALRQIMELQFGPLNQPVAAARACEYMIQRDSQSALARQRLIFYLTMTLQRPKMIAQIRDAIRTGSESREHYVYLFFADSLNFSNGTELNSQWLQSNPEVEQFEVAEAIFIGEKLDASISMDDREEAQAARQALAQKNVVLKRLLEKYPHNSEILAYALRGAMTDGNVQQAARLLSQATVDAEQDNRFWRFKGWIHSQRGESDLAEQAYRRAIELHPLDWGTRYLLADLQQKQLQTSEATRLRSLVSRANELRRQLHAAPNARQVPPEIMAKLADYARDCGDTMFADALANRLKQYTKGQETSS